MESIIIGGGSTCTWTGFTIIIFGLVCGALALILFLFRKKVPKTIFIILEVILILFFIFFSFDYETHYATKCGHDPLVKITIFPSNLMPLK